MRNFFYVVVCRDFDNEKIWKCKGEYIHQLDFAATFEDIVTAIDEGEFEDPIAAILEIDINLAVDKRPSVTNVTSHVFGALADKYQYFGKRPREELLEELREHGIDHHGWHLEV